MTGRPNQHLPFLAVLEDWEIHSPATILRNGIDCGMFSFYTELSQSDEGMAKRRIRHTLSRLSHNHHFPQEGDGLLTCQVKGQKAGFGWYGHRWKKAVGLISEIPRRDVDCVAPRFEKICDKEAPKTLLTRNGLFHLGDVVRIFGLNRKHLIVAAEVLAKGDLKTWEHMGLLPAIHGRWLVMMPIFSRFFAMCQEECGDNPPKWSKCHYLKVCDIHPLRKIKLGKARRQRVQQMKNTERKALGVWQSPHIKGLVALNGLLERMTE